MGGMVDMCLSRSETLKPFVKLKFKLENGNIQEKIMVRKGILKMEE